MQEAIIVSVFTCLFCSYPYFLEVFIIKLGLKKNAMKIKVTEVNQRSTSKNQSFYC